MYEHTNVVMSIF